MKKTLPIYTAFHFLVDLTCIFKVFSTVRPQTDSYENWVVMVVLYNFLAFALPAFEGLAADFIKADLFIAAAGCVFVGAAALIQFPVLAVVILAGIGNGLFHIGAGRKVLLEADGKYSPPGIFISSGALGVFLGMTWSGKYLHPLDYIFAVLMACAAVVLIVLERKERRTAGLAEQAAAGLTERASMASSAIKSAATTGRESVRLLTPAVVMILIVVFLRSYYGFAVKYSWKNTFLISLIFSLCIVGGKALGGITADRIGITKATILSLAGAALTVLFSANIPMLGCLSILLFNMTMPLTLTLIAECWKPYPGMAFGILMMALFLGTLPASLTGNATLPVTGLCIISVISLVLLLATISLAQKESSNAS